MKKIIYKSELGIRIITPVTSIECAKKDIPVGAEYKVVDDADLPNDRTFRDAWNYDLKEDVSKSKEIWKDKLRLERDPIFKSLDIEYYRALEEKKSTTGIVTKKNKLRDITKEVDKAKTIAEIKKVKL